LAKTVAEFVGGGERLLPTLVAAIFEQVKLRGGLLLERRHLNTEQAHFRSLLPVLAKEHSNLLEDFGVELGGLGQRGGACDRSEILVAQLELNRAREERVLTQPARDHFGEAHQRRLEL